MARWVTPSEGSAATAGPAGCAAAVGADAGPEAGASEGGATANAPEPREPHPVRADHSLRADHSASSYSARPPRPVRAVRWGRVRPAPRRAAPARAPGFPVLAGALVQAPPASGSRWAWAVAADVDRRWQGRPGAAGRARPARRTGSAGGPVSPAPARPCRRCRRGPVRMPRPVRIARDECPSSFERLSASSRVVRAWLRTGGRRAPKPARTERGSELGAESRGELGGGERAPRRGEADGYRGDRARMRRRWRSGVGIQTSGTATGSAAPCTCAEAAATAQCDAAR